MKKNWHWLAGGTMFLFFLVLFLFRLGIPDKLFPRSQENLSSSHMSLPSEEIWMNIEQKGRKIGYAQRTFSSNERGGSFSEHLFMKINTMGIVQPLSVNTEARLKPDRTIESFQFKLRSNLFRFKARGVVSGNELTVYVGETGEEKNTIIPLVEPPYLGGGILESLAGKELKVGDEKTFPVFDPASLGQRPVRITMLGEESLMIMGNNRRAKKLSIDFMGMKQIAWIDQDGMVLREEGILGIVLHRVSREEALVGLEGVYGPDLTEIASIPSSHTIDNPSSLKSLKIRLRGLETCASSITSHDNTVQKTQTILSEGHFHFIGDRQTFKNGVLTIRSESPIAPPYRSSGNAIEFAPFLKSTPFIQSDHPDIRNTVAQIIRQDAADGVKAKKIMIWVHKNLEKRPVLSVPNALETLQNRIGDCNEHSVLMAALARAAGIPAEVEAGVVYLRGRFFYHAWNVLYLRDWGGWVTADAVLGQMPADVTHIRFIRGNADRQLDLVGLIGKLNIEVIEAK